MINQLIYMLHNFILLVFGVFLTFSFSGIHFTKKNIVIASVFSLFSGLLQLIFYLTLGEVLVRKLYPFIAHLPLLLLVIFYYHKRFLSTMASIGTAYLCCHPARWVGVLTDELTHLWLGIVTDESSYIFLIEYILRIITLVGVGLVVIFLLSDPIQKIFQKRELNSHILMAIPIVYYIYDYFSGVYTGFGNSVNLVASEFLPFFLCAVFMVVCIIYYNEHLSKTEALQKERLIRITLEQQTKEIDAVKRNEQKIRILRHDLRLLLNNLSMCIENGDMETAKKLIASYENDIEATRVTKYCNILTINYVVSDFAHKCEKASIDFKAQIEIEKFDCDEMMFSTVLSNALENAYNAQKGLPEGSKKIRLMLKTHNGKTLLSVKNKFKEMPVFSDGIPVANEKGHGYGTKSIAYLTERMVGNYQFSVEDDYFILRVII